MSAKVVTKFKPKKKTTTTSTKTEANHEKAETRTTGTAVVVAKPTVSKGETIHENVYEDAVKEIAALAENDAYSRKIDNGPLSEARGKDTWRLHGQLRALDQVDNNLARHVNGIRGSLSEIDNHLHTDTVALTDLVSTTRGDIQKWITGTRGDVQDWITGTKDSLNTNINKTRNDLDATVEGLHKTVKDSFAKLAQATAGTEENLRSQTDAFSKAVEDLFSNVHSELDKKIIEFRDESTRLIDKRFNQADVAFAAIRADQEVIKALLTDIIKDRLGRPTASNR